MGEHSLELIEPRVVAACVCKHQPRKVRFQRKRGQLRSEGVAANGPTSSKIVDGRGSVPSANSVEWTSASVSGTGSSVLGRFLPADCTAQWSVKASNTETSACATHAPTPSAPTPSRGRLGTCKHAPSASIYTACLHAALLCASGRELALKLRRAQFVSVKHHRELDFLADLAVFAQRLLKIEPGTGQESGVKEREDWEETKGN